MKVDIAIVGGGLFGSVIGHHLRQKGKDVVIVDANFEQSGLSAAGCLIKPSWVTKVKNRDECMTLLNQEHGVKTVPFTTFGKRMSVDDCWVVNRLAINAVPKLHATVVGFDKDSLLLDRGQDIDANKVICCIGGWGHLQRPKYGMSFEFDNVEAEPEIKLWRPFTQLVKFNITARTTWAGDGTAVYDWSERYSADTWGRVSKFVGCPVPSRQILGKRPYVHGLKTPALISEEGGVIHVTGGAKNGTIGAAWAALELERMLQ